MPPTAPKPPKDDRPLIEARDLSVRFGRQPVLRQINLSVPRGQTLVVIGESGCGKTVLLKSLIGLVRPTQGTVVFDGQNLAALNDRELARQRIRFGFVFQGAALFDSLTVAQNVAFPLRQQAEYDDARIRRAVLDRLADVGLPENILYKKPAELSGGMRKRVGLARAQIMSPEVILYDEPTTGLDPIMSAVINELILRTRNRIPVTNVVVTHDMQTVAKVADRVVMLHPLSRLKGDEPQVIFDGKPADLERSPDPRVRQFVRGEAGERLMEMGERQTAAT
ncbi:MAG TPA: ATP-binding cassette domain-containing protein [Pirellulales bacterium]|jgi:phospholipid/cholesterol/gamma-HCH transport system ATP-binding protein|nr:ATP-binding cassette domain-containing protein [Pirellulales bacterium]